MVETAGERACRFPTPKCRRGPVIIKRRRRVATDRERTSTARFVGTLLGPHRRVVPPPRSASVVYRILQLMESQETRNKLSRQTDAHRFEATRGSLVGSGRRGNEKVLPPATPHLQVSFSGRLSSTRNISPYARNEISLSSSIYNRPSSPITN